MNNQESSFESNMFLPSRRLGGILKSLVLMSSAAVCSYSSAKNPLLTPIYFGTYCLRVSAISRRNNEDPKESSRQYRSVRYH